MKSNKGLTLIALITYIIITMVAISILTVITSFFRNNLDDMNVATVQDTEFDKINLQILKEIKTENNIIDETLTTSSKLVFSNGNYYTFITEDKALYLNDNIKIAENISSLCFSINYENGQQKLNITTEISGKYRDKEYFLNNCTHNYVDGICTKCGNSE